MGFKLSAETACDNEEIFGNCLFPDFFCCIQLLITLKDQDSHLCFLKILLKPANKPDHPL